MASLPWLQIITVILIVDQIHCQFPTFPSVKCSQDDQERIMAENEHCRNQAAKEVSGDEAVDSRESLKSATCETMRRIVGECADILNWCFEEDDVKKTVKAQKAILASIIKIVMPELDLEECLSNHIQHNETAIAINDQNETTTMSDDNGDPTTTSILNNTIGNDSEEEEEDMKVMVDPQPLSSSNSTTNTRGGANGLGQSSIQNRLMVAIITMISIFMLN